MQSQREHDKLIVVKDGRIVCPICRKRIQEVAVGPNTTARGLQVFCRSCKHETIVDIDKGQCRKGRCQ